MQSHSVSKAIRRNIAMLMRRHAYLDEMRAKAEAGGTEATGFAHAERIALRWALDVLDVVMADDVYAAHREVWRRRPLAMATRQVRRDNVIREAAAWARALSELDAIPDDDSPEREAAERKIEDIELAMHGAVRALEVAP